MPVRRFVSSLVSRSVEPRVRQWIDDAGQEADRRAADLVDRVAELEERSAKLEKKLSMAVGAMQAASAQITQLRTELEQAQNLARQAMQKATSAQATAEVATEGITALESGGSPPAGSLPVRAEPAPKKKRGPAKKSGTET
jgi:dsDNA-specific endonuclease/ATPase MutS2